jgi:hypothetical protein
MAGFNGLISTIFKRSRRFLFRIQPLFDQTLAGGPYLSEQQTTALSGTVYPYNLAPTLDEVAHSRQHELKTRELFLI